MERESLFDITKGIGILLVIWGHTYTPFFAEIYSFHMPLFFIISGVFTNPNKNFKDYLYGKVRRIVFPYILFYVFAYIFYLVFSFVFNTKFDYASILEIIPFNEKLINHPLWFLISLFTVSIIHYFFLKIKNSLIAFIICIGLLIISSLNVIPDVFFINKSFYHLIFYHIGYVAYKNYKFIFTQPASLDQKIIAFIISFALFLVCFNLIPDSGYLRIFVAFIVVLLGSYATVSLSKVVSVIPFVSKGLEYIGCNSLCIFAIQLPLMELTRPVSTLFFEPDTAIWGISNVFINLIITIFFAEILYHLFPVILRRYSPAKKTDK